MVPKVSCSWAYGINDEQNYTECTVGPLPGAGGDPWTRLRPPLGLIGELQLGAWLQPGVLPRRTVTKIKALGFRIFHLELQVQETETGQIGFADVFVHKP
jgi:hypothetical protein